MLLRTSRIAKKCALLNECFHIWNITKREHREEEKERKKERREKLISLLNSLKEGTNKKALFNKILKLKPRNSRTQGISLSPYIRTVWQQGKMPFGSSRVWEGAGEGR